MFYPCVLWYPDNPVVQKYQDLYFEKLLKMLSENGFNYHTDIFSQLSLEECKKFLLYPDICTLIENIWLTVSKEKLTLELDALSEGNKEALSSFQWRNIPKTRIKLTTYDNNPDNSAHSHPDYEGDMLWWWEKEESEWLEVFWNTLSLLEKTNPDFYAEINYLIQKIVPMNTSYGVHNSCSHSTCIGTLYLWYTVDSNSPEVNILEALVHESSHNKLNLIMQKDALHSNDSALQYYSPYRPDARHIHGVLLGVHAIVPTVYIMIQAIQKGYIKDEIWYEKVVLYHIKNKLGYRVLQKYAMFTEIGQKIFDDMWQVMSLCDTMIKQSKELQSIDFQEIQARAKSHFFEVREEYPYVKY